MTSCVLRRTFIGKARALEWKFHKNIVVQFEHVFKEVFFFSFENTIIKIQRWITNA